LNPSKGGGKIEKEEFLLTWFLGICSEQATIYSLFFANQRTCKAKNILTTTTHVSAALAFTLLALFCLPAMGEELNILNEEYAEVISGPSDDYQQVLKGEFKLNTSGVGQTVIGFKDEATGAFDTIRIYLPGALGEYIKSIEILAGDSPTGPFKSVLQTGETQNAKIFKTKGWQELKFAPVTAKYFKINCTTHEYSSTVRVVKDDTQPGLQFIGHVNP
jgi:hypothetical protein